MPGRTSPTGLAPNPTGAPSASRLGRLPAPGPRAGTSRPQPCPVGASRPPGEEVGAGAPEKVRNMIVPMVRKSLLVGASAVAALLVVLLTQSPAPAVNALHDNLVGPLPVDWSPRVLDGRVNAIEEVANRVVIGGSFAEYQQYNSSAVISDRPNLFAINKNTGVIDTGFRPLINGDVQALVGAADGVSVYVAGNFTSVNGQDVRNVVKLNLATGQLDPTFSVRAIGSVLDMVRRGDRLFISGAFTTVNGVARANLAEVDAATGQVRDTVNFAFTDEKLTGSGLGRRSVSKIDVTPDGSLMVAIGNFGRVDGELREQIAMIDLLARPARLHDWQTREFRQQTDAAIAAGSQTQNWCASAFATYMRGVDFSPDGSYFMVTTTGAANFPRLCDTSTRWTTSERGSNLQPQWIDYNGGDTYYDVASTGAAVYVGGHHRWNNNPFGRDSAGPGAVPREGISALDPRNGMPLSWNPGRQRGVGVFDITSTDTGLWLGHDTDRVAQRLRPRATFFPTQSGVLPPDSPGPIPGDLYSGPPPGASNPAFLHRVNIGGEMQFAGDGGIDWATDTNTAPSSLRVAGGQNTSSFTSSGAVSSVPSSTPLGVFDSYRWDPPALPEMRWSFPVDAGREVGVRLYFYNNFDGTASPGQRVFHVEIDGNRVLNNYDIVADVGHRVGTMKEFAVTSDGDVDIEFLRVVENPLIAAIEIYDPLLLDDDQGAGEPLRRRSFDGTNLGPDELAPASGADWSLVRGAFMLSGTLYSGWADGKLYAQPFDGTSFGTRQEVDLNGLTSSQFAIGGLSGMTFDPIRGRLYYTLAGQNNLYFRYFTHESRVVGAQQFVAVSGSSAGITWSTVRGLHLDPQSGTLYLGSSTGELRSVAFDSGRPVTGTLATVQDDLGRNWSSRALFTYAPANYRAPNIAPSPMIRAECDGLTCRFASAGSSDPDGWITSFAWSSSDGASGADYGFERTFSSPGTYQVGLTVTDNEGAAGTTTTEVTVAPAPEPPVALVDIACQGLTCTFDGSGSTPGTSPISSFDWAFSDAKSATAFLHRVNVGGAAQSALDFGIDWAADTNAAPSSFRTNGGENTSAHTSSGDADPSVPSDTPLGVFDSYRWDPPGGDEMRWSFPVDAGREVGVRLYFYNNYDGTQLEGQRVFHVEIDGNRVLNNYDIVADVGHRVGTMKEFVVTSDGSIDIEFLRLVENPLVAAIEIYDPELLADGTATGAVVQRTFDAPGTYEVTLTVTDEGEQSSTTTRSFQVAEAVDGIELVAVVGENRNQTNHPLTIPADTAVGDGMVLVLSTASLVDVVELTGDDRWEPLFEPQDNGQLRLQAWQTVARAGDAGSELIVSLPLATKTDVSLYVYRGTALDGPVAVAAVQPATSDTSVHATPVVNQPVVGARVLSYWTDRSSSTDGWALPASIEEALYEGVGVGGGRVTALAVDQADAVAPYGGLSAQALTGDGMPSASLRAFGATFVLTTQPGTVEPGPGTLEADPDTVEFGAVESGASATAQVRVTNAGPGAVTVSGVTVSGDDAFTLDGGPASVTLGVGEDALYTVAFAPTVVGAVEADLVVTHDGTNSPLTVGLIGEGAEPTTELGTLEADPDTVEFGAVEAGGSETAQVRVTNAGPGAVTVSGVTVSGDDAFTLAGGPASVTLGVGEDALYTVAFAPTVVGAVEADLVVTHDGTNSPLTVGLIGEGAEPTTELGTLEADPDTVEFGAVEAGGSETAQVRVTNAGPGAVTVSGVTVSGDDAFTLAGGPASVTLGVGEDALYTVAFAPTVVGAVEADLVVTHDGTNSPLTVGLIGEGAEPTTELGTLEADPDTVEFGAVEAGGSETAQVRVTNTGPGAVTVSGVTVSGDDAFTLAGGPASVTLGVGEDALYTVAFAPTVVGAVEADLVVAHDGVNDPLTVALSGVGVAVAEPGDGVELVGAVGTNGNLTNYSVVVPQGTAAGDGMVLVLSTAALVDVQSLTGDGRWEPLFEPQDNGQLRLRAWQTVAGADDAGSLLTVGLSSRAKADVSLYVYRGTALDGPVAVAAVQAATSTTSVHATPVVNQPVVGARVLSYWTDRSSSTDGWALPASIEEALYEGAGVGGGRITALAVDQADAVAPYGGLSAQALTGNGMPSASLRAFGATFVLIPQPGTVEPGPGVLAADPVDFGQVGVGGSATASVSVRNMGGSAVSVTQATVGGPFSVTGGPSLPVSVSPGGSVSFEVTFAPTVVGAVEADLVVAHDGVNDPLTVALSGVGVAVAEPGDGVELVGAVGTNGNLTNYSVVVPQGTAAGDGMVLVLSTAALVDVQSLTGDGRWEPLFEPQDNGQLRLRAWQTVAGADDAGSLLTVGLSSRAKADVSLYVYRGTALDGPVAVAAVQAATSTTSVHATPVVNQPVVGARVLSYWTDRSSSTDGWALPASIEEALYEGAGVGGGRITALAVDQADAVAPYGGLSAQALTGNGMPSASLRAFGATFVLTPE
jgi:PKD repeat protein